MQLGRYDRSGRRRPVAIEGAKITLDADLIVPAIGQEPGYDKIDEELNLNKSRSNTLVVDKRTMVTNIEGVFAGGDCVSGPATVVEAIGAGKKAASAIDKYLGGDGVLYQAVEPERKLVGAVAEAGRLVKPNCMPLDAKRLKSFDEVEFAYTEEQAITEAKRCMRCDIKESDDDDNGSCGHCPGCGC